MLHRSFKPAKCKTSLKLAMSRIKLLRNKREMQLKQMKRDLAQLLESGQDRTARIRVEHVVREEKMMSAYDLIEIYCELIVARLPIIESQKNCPIDLKEAIASIIFAAPRCADVPELQDVRKHFTAKYGKEFTTNCLELRPDSGVGRMVVEKLSARAPDGETKIKILTAIAQEHNVKWDPASLAESELKAQQDLLNVPSVTEPIREIPVEPSIVQTPVIHGEKRESSTNVTKTGISSWNSRTSDHTNVMAPAGMVHTSRTEPGVSGRSVGGKEFGQPSSNKDEWNMEFKDANAAAQAAAESAERASRAARAAAEFSIREKTTRQYSKESQEFYREEELKKATDPRLKRNDESVEKTVNDSLKNRIYGQESVMHGHHRQRSEKGSAGFSDNVSSGLQRRKSILNTSPGTSEVNIEDDTADDSLKNPIYGQDSVMHGQQRQRSKKGSSKVNIEDDEIKSDIHEQKNSSDLEADNIKWHNEKYEEDHFVGQSSFTKQVSQSPLNAENYQWHATNDHTDSGEGHTRKQNMNSESSHSFSIDHDHDDAMLDSDYHMYGSASGEQPFIDFGGREKETSKPRPSFNDDSAVVFDEYHSDDETNLDPEDEYPRYSSTIPSPGRSPSRKSENLSTLNSGRHRSGFLEKHHADLHFQPEAYSPELSHSTKGSAIPLGSGDFAPVAFDDSDGLESEFEESNDISPGRKVSIDQLQKQNTLTRSPESEHANKGHRSVISSMGNEAAEVERKPSLDSSSDDSGSDDAFPGRSVGSKVNSRRQSAKEYGLVDSPTNQLSRRSRESLNNSEPLDRKLSYSSVGENHQLMQSSRISLEETSGGKFIAQGSPDTLEDPKDLNYSSSENDTELKFGKLTGGFRNKGFIHPPYHKGNSMDTPSLAGQHPVEDTPSRTEKPVLLSSVRTSMESDSYSKGPYSQKLHEEKMRSISSGKISDTDSDDDEVFLPQTGSKQSHMSARVSRRTRDSNVPSDCSGVSLSPTVLEVPVSVPERKFIPQGSSSTKPISEPQTVSRRSRRTYSPRNNIAGRQHHSNPQATVGRGENSKLARESISVEQQAPKSGLQSEVLVHGESLKSSRPSSAVEQRSSPSPRTSSVADAPNISSSNQGSTSRENSLKKAGHVHPKLPDYDTLAAHFESLKSNR